MAPYEAPEKLTVEAYLGRFNVKPLTQCPVCGKPLLRRELVPVRAHDPPREHRYGRAA